MTQKGDVDWKAPGLLQQLRDLLGAGRSSTQIAVALRPVLGEAITRNAVIGAVMRFRAKGELPPGSGRKHKVERVKLHKPRTKIVGRTVERLKLRGNAPELVEHHEIERPMDLIEFDEGQVGCPLAELRRDQCRWPVSPHSVRTILFCEATQVEGKSYCRTHLYWAHRR